MRALCIIILCTRMVTAAKETTLSFVHPESEEWTRERARQENYEAIRAWHATPEFHDAGHPRERRIDLNEDGRPEVFLLYAGHSYWGGYSGFTERDGAWHFIGRVDLGGQTPVRLKKRRQGWSDFTVDLEGSRGRVDRYLYMWDQKEQTYNERGKFLKQVKPAFPVNDEP